MIFKSSFLYYDQWINQLSTLKGTWFEYHKLLIGHFCNPLDTLNFSLTEFGIQHGLESCFLYKHFLRGNHRFFFLVSLKGRTPCQQIMTEFKELDVRGKDVWQSRKPWNGRLVRTPRPLFHFFFYGNQFRIRQQAEYQWLRNHISLKLGSAIY